jgi:uroporphyrinogen-III decarboxylase
MTRPSLLRHAFLGHTDAPVPCAPLYLSLYLEPPRRLALAAIYRDLAAGADELALTWDLELHARRAAWRRVFSALPANPDWMPAGVGPTRRAVEGARVVLAAGRCLWFAPGATEPSTDYAAFFDNRHADVWEVPSAPTCLADVDRLLPRWNAEGYYDPDQVSVLHDTLTEYADQTLCYASAGSPFWVASNTFGFALLMRNLRDQPALVEAVLQRTLANLSAYVTAIRAAGLDTLFVEECFTGSDLISRADYERFCWPYTRDFLAHAVAQGMLVVFYHTGGVGERLDLLGQLPAQALAFEESKKNFTIDLGEIRRAIGPDKVLFGNSDCVLLRDGSAAAIAADLRSQYDQAGPRYIASLGSPLTLDTPPSQLAHLISSAATLR